MDFRLKEASEKVGIGTVEKPAPENRGVAAGILFLSSVELEKPLVWHRFVYIAAILLWSRDTSKIQDGRQYGRKVMKLCTMSNTSVITENSFNNPNIFDHVRRTGDNADITQRSAMSTGRCISKWRDLNRKYIVSVEWNDISRKFQRLPPHFRPCSNHWSHCRHWPTSADHRNSKWRSINGKGLLILNGTRCHSNFNNYA